ncbi:MAG: thioredoxin domain-containing protein [Limnochordales bacterium]|nr:thioredoxin domain-containing protein [Limnochordales bacterium]
MPYRGRKPNRLIAETSPYLLQHAYNPVDWYPWGKEALEKARRENKPILLSIGYSACHWCHVMARESFENQETADLMNRFYVNIKVDREERPDLDELYQLVALIMGEQGGWPLTVFLTPDLRPFYVGTYFPPRDRLGRPGFPRVLSELSRLFVEERERVEQVATAVQEALENHRQGSTRGAGRGPAQLSSTPIPSPNWLEKAQAAAETLWRYFDHRYGGFGGPPKFPNVPVLEFLLDLYALLPKKQGRWLEMVTKTLLEMARGGIYDQVGGGFHRYSTDSRWIVPHSTPPSMPTALYLVPLKSTAAPGPVQLFPLAILTSMVRRGVSTPGRRRRWSRCSAQKMGDLPVSTSA